MSGSNSSPTFAVSDVTVIVAMRGSSMANHDCGTKATLLRSHSGGYSLPTEELMLTSIGDAPLHVVSSLVSKARSPNIGACRMRGGLFFCFALFALT